MPQAAIIERILKDVRGQTPGALMDAIRAELFNTMSDFLVFTNIWTEEFDIAVNSTDLSYTVTPVEGGRLLLLLNLYDSEDLLKQPVARCQMRVPGQITFWRAPPDNTTWVAVISKSVVTTVDADGNPDDVPDWIWERYYDVLLAGTLQRMFGQGGKPYTNPQGMAYWGRVYLSGKSQARVANIKANVQNQQVAGFPYFAGGSQR